MKIEEFCSKMRDEKDGVFGALGKLREFDAQALFSEPSSLSWNPWASISAEPVGV